MKTEVSQRRSSPPLVVHGLVLCLIVVGCRSQPSPGEDSTEEQTPSAVEDPTGGRAAGRAGSVEPSPLDSTGWTVGRLSSSATLDAGPPPLPVLTSLRTGAHPEYERIVVELASTAGLPGYGLEYVDRPLHECGSGRQIFPVGDAWLELRLEPAAAHTEAGSPTLGDREVAVAGRVVQRIYRTCDFEGVVTLVIAVSTPNRFRVVTLADPSRLAVDVATADESPATGAGTR